MCLPDLKVYENDKDSKTTKFARDYGSLLGHEIDQREARSVCNVSGAHQATQIRLEASIEYYF